jgi:hypothetical protein
VVVGRLGTVVDVPPPLTEVGDPEQAAATRVTTKVMMTMRFRFFTWSSPLGRSGR